MGQKGSTLRPVVPGRNYLSMLSTCLPAPWSSLPLTFESPEENFPFYCRHPFPRLKVQKKKRKAFAHLMPSGCKEGKAMLNFQGIPGVC